MSEASDYAAAFAEVRRRVPLDEEPALTYGDGTLAGADETRDLDAILLGARAAKVWANGEAAAHGSLWVPTSGNGRVYEVITAGTLASPEPTWTTADYGTVTSGTATLREAGRAPANVFDIRRAIFEAWDLKAARAVNKDQYLNDARGQASTFLYLNCVRERDRYAPVGVA